MVVESMRLVKIGNNQQSANPELLTHFEPTAKVLEVQLTGLALGKQQAALIRCGHESNLLIVEKSFGFIQGVFFEMRFELGQPDFHRRPTSTRIGNNILCKGTKERGDLAQAHLHQGILLPTTNRFRIIKERLSRVLPRY